MDSVKYCVRCGTKIADEWSCDWYRYIRLKYCDTCRKAVRQEDTRQRINAVRRQARKDRKEARELIARLQAENEALRKRIHNS